MEQWSWLHYNEVTDKAFCFLCHKAETEGKLNAANNYLALITRVFLNRKDEVGPLGLGTL